MRTDVLPILLALLASVALGAPEENGNPAETATAVTLRTGLPAARATVIATLPTSRGPGAWYGLLFEPEPEGEVLRADGDGTITVPVAPADFDSLLLVSSPGFVPVLVTPVELAGADAMTVELHPGRSQAGEVKDPSGEPVPDARVLFLEEPPPGWLGGPRYGLRGYAVRTDREGRFRRNGLPPGPFLIVVEAGEMGTLFLEGVFPIAGTLGLRLPAAGTLRGTIRKEPAGEPVTGATVTLTALDANPYHATRTATTDENGRWRIGGPSSSIPSAMAP